MLKKTSPFKEALLITTCYGIAGILWITLSDKILGKIIINLELYQRMQTYKGWLYVAITMVVIYVLVKNRMEIAHKALSQAFENYNKVIQTYDELSVVEEELRQQFEELERHRDNLMLSDERYRLAVEGAQDGIWDWDLKNDIFYTSLGYKDSFGYKEGDMRKTYEAWMSLIHPDDKVEAEDKIKKYINKEIDTYENTFRIRCKDGTYRWVLSKAKAIYDSNGIATRVAGSHTDITDWKQMGQKLYSLAYYDSLTGLPNRSMFEEEMNRKLSEYNNTQNKLALIYMNLDNFRLVNDTLGHTAGNELIRYIGKTIEGFSSKCTLCAHLCGDEFALVLEGTKDYNEIENELELLMDRFKKPWIFDGQEIFISFSIGIAISPDHGSELSTLLVNVDTAMEHIKSHGKDGYCFYSNNMKAKRISYIQTFEQINSALENNEFFLHYQPQVDLNTGEVVGLEALIRWAHPKKGLISPMEFIPLAEKTGQIYNISRFVLEEVCRQKRVWQERGYKMVPVAINVSGTTLTRKGLAKDIKQILESHNLKGSDIHIEVTETAIMSDINTAINSLSELQALGIKIALDDFGTGYSSLTYLKKLPIDIVKIDREFIRNIECCHNNNNVILQTVIQLAKGLNLEVVAEGVETKGQLEFLLKSSCQQAQGYWFFKPMPADEIEQML